MPDPDDDELTLGRLIRQQRELAALPLRQLASMAGISNPYLSQIENGLREPSEAVLENIATSLRLAATETDETFDLLRAIAAETSLTASQRSALAETFLAMREVTAERRRRRGTRRRPPS